jgi:hypothetical protein
VARRTKTVSSARTPGSLRRRFRTTGPAAGPLVVEDSIVTLPPTAPPAQHASTPPTGVTDTLPTAPRPDGAPGGTRMLEVDLWGTLMLLNEARYRTIERTFGVPRDQVNMTTAILALVVAEAIHTQAVKVRPSRRPTVADASIGLGVLRESIYSVAGPASRDTPLVGSLIALAILGGLVRPPVARSIRGMKASSRRMHTMFLGRYGHLVGHHRRD